jgi:hydrogenase nickel incorporation protein HypA/HybF
MHELSLCGALAGIVSRRAEDRPVEVVHVRVGQLRQVVPETLAFCWEMVVAQTPLEGSVLDLERVPAVLHCRICEATGPLGDSIALACQSCGALDVEVTAGEEFDVTALDLVRV